MLKNLEDSSKSTVTRDKLENDMYKTLIIYNFTFLEACI